MNVRDFKPVLNDYYKDENVYFNWIKTAIISL